MSFKGECKEIQGIPADLTVDDRERLNPDAKF